MVLDSRNVAGDPADYLNYVMFGWSNTTSGYRLAMERLLKRMPSERDLKEDFIPGVSFHFLYDDLIYAPGYIFDGYHVAKVKDKLDLKAFLYVCVIPLNEESRFKEVVPMELKNRVIYLRYRGEGLEKGNERVYQELVSYSNR